MILGLFLFLSGFLNKKRITLPRLLYKEKNIPEARVDCQVPSKWLPSMAI